MIQSMTGYGKALFTLNSQRYIVEIRSLNSKQIDISAKINPLFRDRELQIRSLLTQRLERGKIDLSIYQDDASNQLQKAYCTPINKQALDYYMHELSNYASEQQQKVGFSELLAIAMRMPEVSKLPENSTLSDEDWEIAEQAIGCAISDFISFRKQEGKALENMFEQKLNALLSLLAQVEPLEAERIEKIRTRLEDNLEHLSAETKQAVDKNRLEQEMIYYLEKLDITEEKVRLRNHIRYFFETMQNPQDGQTGVGKKLGFVAQEMGREINTLGSKSNHSEMQIIVVKMKDILEQIKEQVLNVL